MKQMKCYGKAERIKLKKKKEKMLLSKPRIYIDGKDNKYNYNIRTNKLKVTFWCDFCMVGMRVLVTIYHHYILTKH